jgi:HPt (histidine-containing phosphotransfer) domain-containing protein
LDQFVEQHGDDGNRVLEMLTKGGPAHQLTHTLKGVTSSLGMEALASLAGKTCDAITAGDGSRDELACSLRDALGDVVREVSSNGRG